MTGEAPAFAIVRQLPGYRRVGDQQWEARCPAHEDRKASLQISVGGDGRALLKCLANCETREVLACMELGEADLFPPAAGRPRDTAYPYQDESGKLLFEVVRREPGKNGARKDFLQRHRGANGKWVWEMNGVRRVPYRLPELRRACEAGGEIWVVEGEKDVDNLRAAGLVATCNPGGAGKWRAEYTAAFKGASAAYVVPDNDAPGEKHANAVAAALAGTVPNVKLVRLPAGVKDVSDWLQDGGTAAKLRELAAAVKPPAVGSFDAERARALSEVLAAANGPAGEALSAPAFESAGALLDRDFPKTPWLVRGLLVERALNAVAGEPKTAKTWGGLDLAVSVATGTPAFGQFPTGQPRSVAVFLVEDDARSTRNRFRALCAGRGLDASKALDRVAVKCRGQLDLQNDEQLAWIIASCRSLPELPALLVLDPLRDLHSAKEDKSDEMAPVMARLRLVRDLLGCAVVFVHHASKLGEVTSARRPGQRMRGSSVMHASVDGGLYLSGLDTDGTSRFESTADVELKAVAGAGQFSLRLDVVDDEGGEAIEARWTVTRGEKSGGGDRLDKAQLEVQIGRAHV